jgi:DNA-binding response OmpR family regulator
VTSLYANGNLALEAFSKGSFELCILDIMMPEMDGLTLAKEIRLTNPLIPIIFLTAKNQKEDILEGFKSGADDYITKPFSMEELLYRIEAILRRTAGISLNKKEDSYLIGLYTFDPRKQLLVYKDDSTKLTTKESELLELLCRHGNEILERNFALKTIWIDDNYFNARSMDVYITRLRKYLRKDPAVNILNVHGKGYKLIC